MFFTLSASLLIVDILFKILTAGGESFTIINGVLSMFPLRNYGAAFGILQGGGIWLILATALLIGLITAFYVLHKNKTRFFNISFAFFFAGALGNLIDRIFLGYVRDFIKFDIINWFVGLFSPGYQFPICNFADVFLNASVVMLAIFFIFFDKKTGNDKSLEKANSEEKSDAKAE